MAIVTILRHVVCRYDDGRVIIGVSFDLIHPQIGIQASVKRIFPHLRKQCVKL